MRYLALINNREVELADEQAVIDAFRRGDLPPDAWMKEADEESDWQTVEEMFPAIAQWVQDGHIEIGDQEGFGFVVQALDYGGLVFEDDRPRTLAEAMASLEQRAAEVVQ